jgi:hypothetical protein
LPIGPTGISISGYIYSIFDIQFTIDEKKYKVCINTGYSRPLIDRDWLTGHPDISINIEQSIIVKGIGSRLKLYGLATFVLYIPGKVNGQDALGRVTIRTWVTENLESYLLLGNEFLYSHSTIINLKKNEIVIGTCKDLTAPIIVHYKGRCIIYKVLTVKTVTIPPKSIITIPLIYILLPKEYSYIFEASYNGTRNTITEYINFIIVINPSNKVKKIPVKTRLGTVMEFEKEGYYLI